jgi:hypothetical protein
MDQVLQSPELLTRIVEAIHDDYEESCPKSLTPLARVNALWREIAQRIIWAAPSVEVLACIVRRSRRHLFAPYIRELNFSGYSDPTFHTLFSDLHFPRLTELTLENNPVDHVGGQIVRALDGWNVTVSQYLQPTLEVLVLLECDSICTASFFNQLTMKCPRLKRIFFSGIGAQIQLDKFLSFCRASRDLEAIELNLGTDLTSSPLIAGDFLLHLSRMPKLNYLKLSNLLEQPDDFRMIRDHNDAPFQSLTKFVLSVSARTTFLSHCVP